MSTLVFKSFLSVASKLSGFGGNSRIILDKLPVRNSSCVGQLNWIGGQTVGSKTDSSKHSALKRSAGFVTVTQYLNYQQVAFIMSSPRPLPEDVQANKDKFLNMELDEKRKLYKCGNSYDTLDKILNWKDYFNQEKVQPAEVEGKKYEPNDDLNSKVSLWQGDITTLEIDAIVNAANKSLLGGGGVDGAIHRAAGSELLDECRELKGCATGGAKITGGYKLPAKYVIHTVGPQEEIPDALISCYVNSLQLMLENNLRSIAFPCIATGIYGYPRVGAANLALTTVRNFLEKNPDKVDRIIFTVFLEEDKEVYEEFMQKYFPLQ